jgi:hypothetical protein
VELKNLEDLECADTDLIFVEYEEKSRDYKFEIKKIEFRDDKCGWCGERKMLCLPCSCKEVYNSYIVI